MYSTDRYLPCRITPEIARLARRAKCAPIHMLGLIKRLGLNYTKYAVECQFLGYFKLSRSSLEWKIKSR